MEILKTSIVEALLGKLDKLSFTISKNGKNYCRIPQPSRKLSQARKKKIRKWRRLTRLLGQKWKQLPTEEKETWSQHSKKHPGCHGYNIYIASAHKLLQEKNALKNTKITYPQDLHLHRKKLIDTQKAIHRRKHYQHTAKEIQTTHKHLKKLPIKLTNRLIVPVMRNYTDLKEAFALKLIQRKSSPIRKQYKAFGKRRYKELLSQFTDTN